MPSILPYDTTSYSVVKKPLTEVTIRIQKLVTPNFAPAHYALPNAITLEPTKLPSVSNRPKLLPIDSATPSDVKNHRVYRIPASQSWESHSSNLTKSVSAVQHILASAPNCRFSSDQPTNTLSTKSEPTPTHDATHSIFTPQLDHKPSQGQFPHHEKSASAISLKMALVTQQTESLNYDNAFKLHS